MYDKICTSGSIICYEHIVVLPIMSDFDDLTSIWNDVTEGAEGTTEEQSGLGSQRDISDFDRRIRETIEEMRERYDIRTQLTNEQLALLVREYFSGATDTEIAQQLGDASLDKTVSRARTRLHLFRDVDLDTKVDLNALMECLEAGNSASECGSNLGIAKSTANRYRRLIRAKRQADKVDNKYYKRFRDYCDEDNPDLLPEAQSWDGLEDAVAGAGADNPAI